MKIPIKSINNRKKEIKFKNPTAHESFYNMI